MSELDALYQELILEHARRPRHFGPLPAASRSAHGENPFCGDEITLHLRLAPGIQATFEGQGCAIAMAAASLMSEAIQGKTPEQARDLAARFERLIGGDPQAATGLGPLAALCGVSRFPVRRECARLPWRTLLEALAPFSSGAQLAPR